MAYKFPRGKGPGPFAISWKLWNRLVDAVERLGKFSVAPPLEFIDHPGGRLLRVNIPAANPFFRVNLTRNGGSDGVANVSRASWTYDVFVEKADGSDGDQLNDTPIAIEKDRLFASPASTATKGFAYYAASGDLRIWEANETYGAGCPT